MPLSSLVKLSSQPCNVLSFCFFSRHHSCKESENLVILKKYCILIIKDHFLLFEVPDALKGSPDSIQAQSQAMVQTEVP